jgi:DNA primase
LAGMPAAFRPGCIPIDSQQKESQMSSSALWQDFKEKVRTSTDLVSLVSETVTLQPMGGGREYKGLCPFHGDHTPSMVVYPERQSFRCWACQTGGDCFEFVMQRDKVSFREALEALADRARLELPKGTHGPVNPEAQEGVSKSQLHEVLGWAENLFHEFLWSDAGAQDARNYLTERGVQPETIQRFKLGFHPDNWEWLQRQAKAKFSKEQLLAARLIGERPNGGGYYDNFVDRVTFPIYDPQGKTVAFGGRVLPNAPASNQGKYWNSPESVIFSKSRIIYGLHHARKAIDEAGTAIVMEGYMDCIMAQQAGVANCVATLGTALTEHHVTILKRLARTVVQVYDGDEAGQNATEKSLAKFLAQELDLRILTLTGDQDPADVMLDQGAEWFLDQAAKAPEVWEFKLKRVIQRYGVNTIDGAHRVLEEMLGLLCEVPTFLGSMPTGRWQLREDILLGKLFQRLGLPEQNVRNRLKELRKAHTEKTLNNAAVSNMNLSGGTPQSRASSSQIQRLMRRPTTDEQIEAELLQLVLLYPETLNSIRQQIAPEEIKCPELRQLWKVCLDLADRQILPSIQNILLQLEQSELTPLAVWLDEDGRRRQGRSEFQFLFDHAMQAVRRRRVLNSGTRPQDGLEATPDNLKTNQPVDSKTLMQQITEKQRRLQRPDSET